MSFTTTTNFQLKKPIVGGSGDLWGSYLNESLDTIDSTLQTLTVSISSQDLEDLGNVLNNTAATGQLLQFNGTNWAAATVSIPSSVDDLSDVDITTTSPSTGDSLVWDGSQFTPQTASAASITDGSITAAKLSTGLQTVIGRILVTDDDTSPTDNQILVYSTTDSEWKYADQAGSTVQTLGDVDTTGLADNAVLIYNSTDGEFELESGATLRTSLGVDAAGTDNSTPTSLVTTSHDYLSLSGQAITLNAIDLATDVTGTLPVANGGTNATDASGARTSLGLVIGTNILAYDAGLNSIAGLTTVADKLIYTTAADTYQLTDLTAFARTILDDADAATVRTTLGLGTAASSATGDFEASGAVSTHAALTTSVHGISSFGATLVDDADAATARTTLGLGTAATTAASAYATSAQGTTADSATQPGDNATTLNVTATDKLLGRSTAGAGAVEEITLTSAGRALLDDADAAAQRTTLGLGTAATTAATDYATSAQGTTADTALQDLVDDTTPQLGGDLDVNGQSIVSVSAGDIAITPDTTGKIILDGLAWPTADGTTDQVLKTDGAGNLSFVDQSGGGGGLTNLEHANSVTTAETISSGNHRFYVGPVSFSNTVTIAGKLLVFDGLCNTTNTINITGTLHVRS